VTFSSHAVQILRLADGRDLAWCERGVATGVPVFVFHGLPGSRLQRHPDESISASLGARIISTDRPGFGRSSPQPDRKLSDWAKDVAALADHLKLQQFAVLGISGGGPSACACAAALGKRITRAAIVSGVGPPGSMPGDMLWPARLGFSVATSAAWALRMPLALSAPLISHAPEQFIDLMAMQMSQVDRTLLKRPDVRAVMTEDLKECFRQGARGFTDDLQLSASEWDIDPGATRCVTRLWHGSADSLIPVAAMRHLAAQIPRAQQELLEGDGHFLIYDRWREILRWLLAVSPDELT
jgi:pimeloyl-ACP methyl ester carboxylesterase